MQKIYIKGFVTKAEGGKYKVLASTSAIDRQGDSIDQTGWDLSNFKKNPVMPWAHDYSALPVAKATSVEVTKAGLECEFEFAPAEGNPMAQQVKVLYDNGYLNAVSVGFIPKTRKGNVILSAELLEISFVPVPANQEALRLAAKSIEDGTVIVGGGMHEAITFMLKSIKDMEEKGAVADELSAEEKLEAKYKKWCELWDIMGAFGKVYFDEATPVEDFSVLLSEAIVLMQELADADGEEPAEEPAEEEPATDEGTDTNTDDEQRSVKKNISAETTKFFTDFLESKAGRTLSSKTLENINAAIDSMKTATTVLEKLKDDSSSESSDGKAAESVEVKENVNDGMIHLSLEDMRQVRQSLVANDKTNELALSIVNAHIRAKGAQA